MAFATLAIDLVAKIATFEENMKRAGSSVDSFAERGRALANVLSSPFGLLASGGGIAGIAAFSKSAIDAADEMGKLSQRVGVSVYDLASLKRAAEQSDTSIEGLGQGMAKLSRSIGEAQRGNKDLAAALAELGITARDPKEAFFQLADATQRIQDPAKRAALLNKVLSESYQDLIPLLNQGGDGLMEAAKDAADYAEKMAKLSPEAERFNDGLTAMKLNFEELAATVAGPGVTSLNEYLRAFKEITENGSTLDKVKFFGFGYIGEDVMNRIGDAGERVQAYNAEIFKLQQQLLELRRVEAEGSPNIAIWEKRIAELEKTRAELVARAREDAAKSLGGAATDAENYGAKLQAALLKAFSSNPLDQFLNKLKDRRQSIAAEYAALKAEMEGGPAGAASSLDVSLQLNLGRSALESGNADAAEAAIKRAKSLFRDLAAQEGTAGFEKSYFLRELERLETDVVDKSENVANAGNEAFRARLEQLNAEAATLKIEIDEKLVLRQADSIYEQVQKRFAEKPLTMPIVPSVSTTGLQSVDLATAATQYGGRR